MKNHRLFPFLSALGGIIVILCFKNPLYGADSLSMASNTGGLLDSSIATAMKDDLQKAEDIYLQVLDNANKTGDYLILENIRMLFSGRDQKEYDRTTNPKAFIKDFWLMRDPTPKTAANERLQEHLYRTGYSRTHFHLPGSFRSFDERGVIYVKYGTPTSRCEQPGDVISLPQDGGTPGERSLLHGGGAAKPLDLMRTLTVQSTETWVYNYESEGKQESLVYDFINVGNTFFKQAKDLTEATNSAFSFNQSDQDAYAPGWAVIVKMYQQRYPMFPAFYKNISIFTKSAFDFVNNIQEIRNKKQEMYLHAPAELFTHRMFPNKNIPVHIESACFRGENGKTRQEIYYAYPLNSLKFTQTAATQTGSFNYELILRVDRKNDLYYDFQTIKLESGQDPLSGTDWYTGQINTVVPPQPPMSIALLTIEDINDEKVSTTCHRLFSKDLTGDSLMLSDIKFSYNITASQGKDVFTRDGLRIIPLTTNRLSLEKPVSVYFEIYNLQSGEQNKVNYKVHYIVQKTTVDSAKGPLVFDVSKPSFPPPPPFANGTNDYIGNENEMNGSGAEQRHNFTVDMSKLKEGNYDFIIYVMDSNSSRYAYTYRHIVLESANKKKK